MQTTIAASDLKGSRRRHLIEEFRIIGFYLYHVTSNRPSDSNGTSGLCTVLLNIDYDRGSSSYYSYLMAFAGISQCL